MNSFMSWVGGKKALRDDVIIRMPPFYDKYIEVLSVQVGFCSGKRLRMRLKFSTISTAIS